MERLTEDSWRYSAYDTATHRALSDMGEASSDSGAHAPSAYIWYAFAAAFLSTVGAGGVKLAFSNLLAADLLGRLCPIADSPCYKVRFPANS
jgi:hypothetical protein